MSYLKKKKSLQTFVAITFLNTITKLFVVYEYILFRNKTFKIFMIYRYDPI